MLPGGVLSYIDEHQIYMTPKSNPNPQENP